MSELRWNPLLKTWTMVASNRQARPNMPKDWCPFCPGSGRVPDDYDVYKYDNDFPALKQNPDVPDLEGTELYKVAENYGKCEVILYSPEHTKTLPELSVEHIYKLVNLWTERFRELSKDERIKYIFEFENRGEEVGVTMPHPHGQIYGYSYVPLKLKVELDSCKEYYQDSGKCMICQMNHEEISFNKRIVTENDSFLAYIPFFTDYPYGVFIVSKNHKGNFTEFTDKEKWDLAEILRNVTGAFDNLFDRLFPYMMCIHQTPVNSEEYKDSDKYYHFHIEFYPPLRDKDKIKFYASSEMGAWAAANTMAVEDAAERLREALEKFKAKIGR
ncbi:Galactose-1-phosphate uridylyltransferase [Caloramator mitchellensis]|uniref:Galactose-1-phosphate uridylyltransferase n=1 Tax=Caloramator mitchellensis TaxID=908809 RepID=A0A0R3K414_CALMK|nr:galactose-1-phosphate uridylyltransferase [Caloramator mitchellensis]KRQ87682.1 Galactose-1-phosphate uridylyltransferase [Caloramator mitchellensis]